MSKHELNEFRHIKKTRKHKCCSLCGRTIPVGHKAHNYVGYLEGDFQDWNLCDFCFQNVLDKVENGGYLDSDYFWQYFRDNCLVCPDCGEFDEYKDNYRFPNSYSETVNCECSHCGHKYVVNIPFDVLECEKVQTMNLSNRKGDQIMCDICKQSPCPAACPNAPDKVVGVCDYCLNSILESEPRIMLDDGGTYHLDCLDGLPVELLLDTFGIKYEIED